MSEPRKSDTRSAATDAASATVAAGQRSVKVKTVRRESMWKDPVVRILGIVLAVIIVGALLTTVFALLNGTIDLSGAPENATQRESIVAKDNWQKTQSDPKVWLTYFLTLIDTKQISQAEAIYQQAKDAKLEQPSDGGQELLFMQAALARAKGDDKAALKYYTECANKLKEAYDAEMKRGGEQNWAMSFGINGNWQLAKEQIAKIQLEDKDYKGALATLNELIARYPTEAGYYIDRGKVKLELGDKAGAKSDFETALKYLPDNAEAKAGLEKAK